MRLSIRNILCGSAAASLMALTPLRAHAVVDTITASGLYNSDPFSISIAFDPTQLTTIESGLYFLPASASVTITSEGVTLPSYNTVAGYYGPNGSLDGSDISVSPGGLGFTLYSIQGVPIDGTTIHTSAFTVYGISTTIPAPNITTFSGSYSSPVDYDPCAGGYNYCYSDQVYGIYPDSRGNPSYGYLSEYIGAQIYNVSINAGTAPPTTLDLSEIAQQAYNNSSLPPTIDGYKSVQTVLGSAGFFAQVYQNGNQVVVSFRGTTLSTQSSSEYNNLKTLVADQTFVTGTPNAIFTSEVSQAATLLKTLAAEPQFAGDSFTLTGHSLGGAVAQLLGNATGLPTTAFDAPGAANLVKSLTSVLNFSGTTFNNNGTNENIRLFGDQISLIGGTSGQIGKQYTLSDTAAGTAATILFPELSFIGDHSIQTIVSQLGANAPLAAGITGPNLDLTRAIVTQGINLVFPVTALQKVELDPDAGTFYQLMGKPGSPDLNTLALPLFPSITSYDLEMKTSAGWSSPVQVAPGDFYTFGSGVTGVEFWGTNTAGQSVSLPNEFIFDATFTSSGTFDGTLAAISSAPEPSTWLLLLIGTGFVGVSLRRRKCEINTIA